MPRVPRPHALSLGGRRVVVHGLERRVWQDFYHRCLTIGWPPFFAVAAAAFAVLNATFACLYAFGPGTPIANLSPPNLAGAFFFSVETLATVGYGDMHPQTLYAHLVATCEIFLGMSGIAVYTGLIFARFSRPRAKVLFARYPVVREVDGRTMLMARAANGRQNVLAEASARLRLLRNETSAEGMTLRRIHDLRLERDQHPVFLLGWTLMHVIDASSPLYGATPDSLAAVNASLEVSIGGVDETTAQQMQARHSYPHAAIRWNHAYADVMSVDADGFDHIDYTRFHDVMPLGGGA